MSNTVITLLVVFAFAAGLGLGLVTILRPRKPEPRAGQKTESTVYFGRDDKDDPNHPHDIERAAAHRYDGMTDGDAPYIPSGLDFADRPR
jgi:hypothetical protein